MLNTIITNIKGKGMLKKSFKLIDEIDDRQELWDLYTKVMNKVDKMPILKRIDLMKRIDKVTSYIFDRRNELAKPKPVEVVKTKEVVELEEQLEATERAIAKTIAAQKELDELIKQAELDVKKAKIEAERDIAKQEIVTEKQLKVTKLVKQEVAAAKEELKQTKKLRAIQEDLNIARAKLRAQLNLERVFTQQQRTQLLIRASGQCEICGDEVNIDTFEADHIIPYSKGGPTTIENGQCLCRRCNRVKSNG